MSVSQRTNQDRWLAKAANALVEAQELTRLLALSRPQHDLTVIRVQSDITGLMLVIEQFQRERKVSMRREFHPSWLPYSAWSSTP